LAEKRQWWRKWRKNYATRRVLHTFQLVTCERPAVDLLYVSAEGKMGYRFVIVSSKGFLGVHIVFKFL